jgi:hypothetical protein
MSAVKRFQGPWIVGHEDDSDFCLIGTDSGNGLVVHPVIRTHDEELARLIAAAPELLEALQAEQEWREREADGALDPEWDYERMVGDKRRAAIAKAGSQP